MISTFSNLRKLLLDRYTGSYIASNMALESIEGLYIFDQKIPSAIWNLKHNFSNPNYIINIYVLQNDGTYDRAYPDLIQSDDTEIILDFGDIETIGYACILFAENDLKIIPTQTATPMITPTPTPSAVSATPLTFNVTNAYGYQIFACGASNNAAIDWGDGNIDIIPDGAPDGSDNACSNGISHTYAVAGNYTIKIYGNYIANAGDANFGGIYMYLLPADQGGSSSTLVTWGNGNISQVGFAADIISVPNYLPSTLTLMAGMFADAKIFNQDISSWDTSNVTNMSAMFYGTLAFNQNLNLWNTSNVTDMSSMFQGTKAFNGNISSWDTSNVTNMSAMFYGTLAFNQNLNLWNTNNVTDMSFMFSGATAFNQNIYGWNTINVTNMNYMFQGALAFNRNISSWNTSKVTSMRGMFSATPVFNQNISSWDTSMVIDMGAMFSGATAFNQNLNTWNTSNVTDMSYMFSEATAFNQNLSSWCVTNIPSLPSNFDTGAIAWSLPRPIWGTCP